MACSISEQHAIRVYEGELIDQDQKGGSQKGYPPFFILKTLRRKLYMASMTPPQTMIMMLWIFGSAVLGTLRAREMVAKARMPSEGVR